MCCRFTVLEAQKPISCTVMRKKVGSAVARHGSPARPCHVVLLCRGLNRTREDIVRPEHRTSHHGSGREHRARVVESTEEEPTYIHPSLNNNTLLPSFPSFLPSVCHVRNGMWGGGVHAESVTEGVAFLTGLTHCSRVRGADIRTGKWT